jgi:hypothetical protein
MNPRHTLRACGAVGLGARGLLRFVGERNDQDARSAKWRPGLRIWRCTTLIQVRIQQHQIRMPLGQGLGGVGTSDGAGASGETRQHPPQPQRGFAKDAALVGE